MPRDINAHGSVGFLQGSRDLSRLPIPEIDVSVPVPTADVLSVGTAAESAGVSGREVAREGLFLVPPKLVRGVVRVDLVVQTL